ncbi:hypothetical protein [Calothrix sp. 336/3]|uniref:hypothetical protein n=1 Tax=Calothrix sp. 336/3 TaxID=1337936 RepID=UPI000A8443D1|nr:hypothetical protein [Calothrix sp. 336/3]
MKSLYPISASKPIANFVWSWESTALGVNYLFMGDMGDSSQNSTFSKIKGLNFVNLGIFPEGNHGLRYASIIDVEITASRQVQKSGRYR